MVRKDQTLEALAAIRMSIDDNNKIIERELTRDTDPDDFPLSTDDGGGDQPEPNDLHWKLGAPSRPLQISDIKRRDIPAFEGKLRQFLAEFAPEEFTSGGFVPIKVSHCLHRITLKLLLRIRWAGATFRMSLSYLSISRGLDGWT